MTHRNPFPLRLPHSSPLLSYFLFSLLFSTFVGISLHVCIFLSFCLSFYIYLSIYLSISAPSPCATPKRSSIFLLPPAVQKRRPKASEPTHHLTRVWGFSSEARFISRVHVVSEELLLCRDMLVLTAKCVLRGRRRRAVVFRLFY